VSSLVREIFEELGLFKIFQVRGAQAPRSFAIFPLQQLPGIERIIVAYGLAQVGIARYLEPLADLFCCQIGGLIELQRKGFGHRKTSD